MLATDANVVFRYLNVYEPQQRERATRRIEGALHLAGAVDTEAFLSFDGDLAKSAVKVGAPAAPEA